MSTPPPQEPLASQKPLPPQEPLLRARSLQMRYGRRWALRDVSLQVHAGRACAVIGPNGAGKTTLLSILAGTRRPTAGAVEIAPGCPVGWVPQHTALYLRLSVAENLRLFARLRGVRDHRAAVEAMLAQADLAGRANERVGRLSGGSRQRVSIAIGLLGGPRVLLLDEPSASLDPRQRERLWRFIQTLLDGGTSVVFSTHNVAEAERYAQEVVVLADGEVLFGGSPQQLTRDVADLTGDVADVTGERADFESRFVAFLEQRGH